MHNDFFDRTAAEKWELIKEVFWRIFAPRAYATLYSQYQFLRSSIDEMEEEARCDVIDAENEVRRLQRENQALRQQIDALTAQLQALQTYKNRPPEGEFGGRFFCWEQQSRTGNMRGVTLLQGMGEEKRGDMA